MEKETRMKGIDIWLQKLLKVSIDRRKKIERRASNRRLGFDRRMQKINVSIDRRKCSDRRSYV